jgi:prepilin-type N-terminal cleavage/methylation domain-containing protein
MLQGGRARRSHSEEGFTLVELVVAMGLALIVAVAAMAFLIITLTQQNAVASRAVAARQAEVVLQRMTRELRQAQAIYGASGTNTTPVNVVYGGGTSSVSFWLPNAGSTAAGTQVTWTCTAGVTCTRTASGSSVTELTGVNSATFLPIGTAGALLASDAGTGGSPSYPSTVQVALLVNVTSQLDSGQTHLAQGASQPITVRDGAALRNYGS